MISQAANTGRAAVGHASLQRHRWEEEYASGKKNWLRTPAMPTLLCKWVRNRISRFFDSFRGLLFVASARRTKFLPPMADKSDNSPRSGSRIQFSRLNNCGRQTHGRPAWRNSRRCPRQIQRFPELSSDKQDEDYQADVLCLYLCLSLYARMDDLRSRGILSPNS